MTEVNDLLGKGPSGADADTLTWDDLTGVRWDDLASDVELEDAILEATLGDTEAGGR